MVPKSKLQEQANDSVRSWNKLKMWRFPLHSTQLCSCLSQHCFPQIGNNSSWEEKLVVLPPKEWQIYSEFIFNFTQFVTQPWRPWIDYSRSLESSKSSESHSVMSHSLWPHGLYSPWNSPGQNSGVGSLSFLLGIFPTKGLNPGLLHCRQILYQLSHKGSLRILEWVACPFSSGSCWPRNRTRVSCMTGGFSTSWVIREVQSPLKQLFRVWIHENLIEKGTLVHCWWECKLVQPLWKTVWRFLKTLKMEFQYDPAIPLLSIYPKNMEIIIQKDTYIPIS